VGGKARCVFGEEGEGVAKKKKPNPPPPPPFPETVAFALAHHAGWRVE